MGIPHPSPSCVKWSGNENTLVLLVISISPSISPAPVRTMGKFRADSEAEGSAKSHKHHSSLRCPNTWDCVSILQPLYLPLPTTLPNTLPQYL